MLEIIREGIRSCVQTGVAAASIMTHVALAPRIHAVGMCSIKSFIYPMCENRQGLQCVDHSAVRRTPKWQQRAKQVVLATSSAVMHGASATVAVLPAIMFSQELTNPESAFSKELIQSLMIGYIVGNVIRGYEQGVQVADNTRCNTCSLRRIATIP